MDWAVAGRAAFWGTIGGLIAIQTGGGLPKTSVEWAGFALAILWAAYGKGSTKQSMWALSRTPWTDEERFGKAPVETEDQRRARLQQPPKRPPNVS